MLNTLSAQERGAIAIYNQRVRDKDTGDEALWVDPFTRHIFATTPADGEVVDVGCGIGRAIPMLPDLGAFNGYFGIDPAEDQIAYCREHFPELSFEVNEIRRIGAAYPKRFDGFLCIAVLMHVPRSDIDLALRSLRASLKDGANGLLSLPYGDTMVRDNCVFGVNITLYTIDEMFLALKRNGFQIERDRIDEPMYICHVTAV